MQASGSLADANIHDDTISTENESNVDVEVVLNVNSVTPVSESDRTHVLNTLPRIETHHELFSIIQYESADGASGEHNILSIIHLIDGNKSPLRHGRIEILGYPFWIKKSQVLTCF